MQTGWDSMGQFTCASVILLLCVAVALGTNETAAQVRTLPEPVETWVKDLQEVRDWAQVYEPVRKQLRGRVVSEEYGPLHAKVTFLGDSKVAVTFFAESPGERDSSQRSLLKAMFFDVATGELKRVMEWPSSGATEDKLFPLHDGGFLVRVGDQLFRFSDDFVLLKQRALAEGKASDGRSLRHWEVSVAPGGRLVVLALVERDASTGKRGTGYTWIDADTFEDRASVDTTETWVHISGEFLLVESRAEHRPNQEGPLRAVRFDNRVRDPQREWRPLGFPEYHVRAFLTNNLLIATNEDSEIAVLDREAGRVLSKSRLSWARSAPLEVRTSMKGNRFAVLDSEDATPLIEKRAYFDFRFFLKVYDVTAKLLVAVRPLGAHSATLVDHAISADGSAVAVLTESMLRFYRIP